MKELKKESCIIIKPFMVTELNLKGNSLLLYALIYGISVNKGAFYGSIEYMQTWCNASNRNVIDCLKELIKKGLITKRKNGNTVLYTANTPSSVQKEDEDCPFPEYKESEESSHQSEESSLVGVKKVHSESEESSHNILDINLNKKEFINSSPSNSESEPFPEYTPSKTKRTRKSGNNKPVVSFPQKDYDDVMSIYYENRDILSDTQNVESTKYLRKSYQSIIKPYFIDYGVDTVKQAVRNSIHHSWIKNTEYSLSVVFNRKKFDEYVADSKGVSSKPRYQNPRTTGGMDYHKQAEHYDIKY